MFMLVSYVWWIALTLDIAVWAVVALLAGWAHRRSPLDELQSDGPLLRLWSFEEAGRWYQRRLRIKSWKDHLPEAGSRFGGMTKRRLPGRAVADLERFAAECRRGERTHWTIMAGVTPMSLWNPYELFLVMGGAGVAGNTPFVAVLRYNRARITSILQKGADSCCPPSVIPTCRVTRATSSGLR